jgi:predicted ester cyclase
MADPPTPHDLIVALNATINDHDVQAGRAFYDPAARLVTAAGKQLDVDGVCGLMQHTMTAFPDLRMTVLRWIAQGDTIVTEEVMDATHQGEFGGMAPTGLAVRVPMVHFTRVLGGRIIERVAYHDSAAILRQLQAAGR